MLEIFINIKLKNQIGNFYSLNFTGNSRKNIKTHLRAERWNFSKKLNKKCKDWVWERIF